MTRGGDSSDCTEVHEKTVVNKYFQFKLFDNKFVMKFAITVKKIITSKLIGQWPVSQPISVECVHFLSRTLCSSHPSHF